MTPIVSVALAHARRKSLRSAVTATGVALAIGLLFFLLSFQRGYQKGVVSELDRLGAHLIVVPKGCPYDAASIALHGAAWPCYLKAAYLAEVASTKGVAVAAGVLMTAKFDSGGAQRVYCGVDRSLLALRPNWTFSSGRFFAAPGEIVVGSQLATEKNWRVGDTIALPGFDNGRAKLCGILAPTGGADDTFFYLPLTDAQTLFARPASLTHILVRLTDPETVDSVTADLRGCDAGLQMTIVPLAHLFETISGLIRATRLLLYSLCAVALLAAGAGVTNTVLMAVTERTRDIGVLRAIGASAGQVFGMIWLETVALCFVGGLLGIGLALLGASGGESLLRARLPFAPTDPLSAPDWRTFAFCVAVGPVLGTLAALVPALRAARLSPSVAMRDFR